MCATSVNEAFDAAAGRLQRSASMLIVCHARPDGDCLGAMAALAASARAAGKSAATLSPDKVPARYEFLFGSRLPAPATQFAALADAADVIVIVDTCAMAQLDVVGPQVQQRREKVVVIDHHATCDSLGDVQWIDNSASAAGVMVLEMIDVLNWPLPPEAAEAVMTALTTDTGWLRFANTDARCLAAAGRCITLGVRPDRLYQRLFQTDRPQRLALVGRMLATLELRAGDRLASMMIRKADFEATGALPEETENLVNEALRIGSVDTAILLVESGDCIRVSLRSRDAVNVAEVAKAFGGGGHARAAGVRVTCDIHDLRRKLVEACEKALSTDYTDYTDYTEKKEEKA